MSGSVGYALSKRARMSAGTPWTGTVIWWQVGVGLAFLAVALILWRLGVRDVRSELPRA